MPKNNANLLPCPFCGGEAEIHPSNDWDVRFTGATYFAWCDKCETRGDYYSTEAEAIAAWNTRDERTCTNIAYDAYVCSICGQLWDYIPNYCPKCGSKVVEDAQEQHKL